MENSDWIESRIKNLEVDYLQQIFNCGTPQAVEAATTYARFMSSVGVTPENCVVFLRLLDIENRWVVNALVGDGDPFKMLSSVQPNQVLLKHLFGTLSRWHRGSIHVKNLAAVLGVLQSVYASPHDGYRLYPPTLVEINALGKHLEKSKGQDDPVNRAILHCLDKFSELDNPDDDVMDSIAIQATALRNVFFDDRRQLLDVLPEVVLEAGEKVEEVAPRKEQKFQSAAKGTAAKGKPKAGKSN